MAFKIIRKIIKYQIMNILQSRAYHFSEMHSFPANREPCSTASLHKHFTNYKHAPQIIFLFRSTRPLSIMFMKSAHYIENCLLTDS